MQMQHVKMSNYFSLDCSCAIFLVAQQRQHVKHSQGGRISYCIAKRACYAVAMNKPIQYVRNVAVYLLDNSEGVTEQTWLYLLKELQNEGGSSDIIKSVQCINGRHLLPEGWRKNSCNSLDDRDS